MKAAAGGVNPSGSGFQFVPEDCAIVYLRTGKAEPPNRGQEAGNGFQIPRDDGVQYRQFKEKEVLEMRNLPVKEILYGLKAYYPNAEETEQNIINCALVAAGADAVSSLIPGLAVPATITACFGTVWVMYGKLSKKLGISLKDNVLKLLARAALANIGANLGGALLAMVVGMLIPGASVLASAVVAFATVYLAGMIFLQLILKLAKKSGNIHDFSDISESEMERAVKDTKVSKEDLNAAKQAYRENKDKAA